MVTVVRTPKFGAASAGFGLGRGAGKGLTEEFGRQREAKEKEERSKKIQGGIQKLQEAMSTAGDFEAAQDIEPFQFFTGLITDIDDANEILGVKTKFLERNFPERVQSVTKEGDLAGLISKGRREGKQKPGTLTVDEFAKLERARASKASRKKGSKRTLSDAKLEIIDQMTRNEARGKPREENLTNAQVEFVASEMRDPNLPFVVGILANSNLYFREKNDFARAKMASDMIKYVNGGFKAKDIPKGMSKEEIQAAALAAAAKADEPGRFTTFLKELFGQDKDKKEKVTELPPGSKQVGTADGKAVFESPDGRRFIVE